MVGNVNQRTRSSKEETVRINQSARRGQRPSIPSGLGFTGAFAPGGSEAVGDEDLSLEYASFGKYDVVAIALCPLPVLATDIFDEFSGGTGGIG